MNAKQMRMRRVIVEDSVELVVAAAGNENAPAIVLLHGGGQTRNSWDNAALALADAGYHAISFDARGHGESVWSPDSDYRLNVRARDLLAVIRDVTTPIAFVGASMGGQTSLYAIGKGYCPQAKALVLVDIVPKPARTGIQKVSDFMHRHQDGFATLDEAAEATATYNPIRKRTANPAGLNKNLRLRSDGRLYWHWDPGILKLGADDMLAQQEQELIDACAGVRVPVLLVRGAKSDVVDDDAIAQFKRSLPLLEVSSVAGAGHMVAGDDNDAFNQSTIEFMLKHMPPRF